MLAQQQTLTQLLDLIQQAQAALQAVVRDRVSAAAIDTMHSDEEVRRKALQGDRCVCACVCVCAWVRVCVCVRERECVFAVCTCMHVVRVCERECVCVVCMCVVCVHVHVCCVCAVCMCARACVIVC